MVGADGSLTLQPFTSIILVDNGLAPLTLHSITPALVGASGTAGFSPRLQGSEFTPDSVVRWNGSPRPASFVSSTCLSAAITADDVSHTGVYPVTVWDPHQGTAGAETPAINLTVVTQIYSLYLPQIAH